MTAPLRPDPPLYAAVAMDCLASGVGVPLPLPPQAKQYPPKGSPAGRASASGVGS